MFCIYRGGAVQKVFRNELKIDSGTYPAAWLRVRESRETLDVYMFEDQSKNGTNEFYSMGAATDAAPNSDGIVIRTTAKVAKSVDIAKKVIVSKIKDMRTSVARAGVIYDSKNFSTDASSVENINLLESKGFDSDTIAWETMDTPKVASTVYTADEAKFSALRTVIATHFKSCTNNAQAHITAVNDLTDFDDVVAYDFTENWPNNPDMGDE
jgi:hypothetical protein